MAMQGRTDQIVRTLFIGDGSLYHRDNETILQDAGRVTPLAPYTLMGRVCVAVPANGTADAANAAGTGTLTSVGLIAGTLPKVGTWTVECIATEGHGGTFEVKDPGGNIVRNDLVMTAGAGLATTFYIPEIGMKFTITDGATDFIVGEKFTIAVTAVNKWTPFSAAAVNGAQIPRGVFVGDAITAAALVAGDVTGKQIVVAGIGALFDSDLLVIEGGSTLATVLPGGDTLREALYKLGFFDVVTFDVDKLENT